MASPIGPIDASKTPRFAGPATFARLPRLDQVPRADVAVVGVPFDAGVSYRPGARFGPTHVREASRLLRPYNPALDVSPFEIAQVVEWVSDSRYMTGSIVHVDGGLGARL